MSLYKIEDRHHFKDYRLVSKLPQFFKPLEKLFNNRFNKLFDTFKLLPDSQYGFSSTSPSLTESSEEITDAIV